MAESVRRKPAFQQTIPTFYPGESSRSAPSIQGARLGLPEDSK